MRTCFPGGGVYDQAATFLDLQVHLHGNDWDVLHAFSEFYELIFFCFVGVFSSYVI